MYVNVVTIGEMNLNGDVIHQVGDVSGFPTIEGRRASLVKFLGSAREVLHPTTVVIPAPAPPGTNLTITNTHTLIIE